MATQNNINLYTKHRGSKGNRLMNRISTKGFLLMAFFGTILFLWYIILISLNDTVNNSQINELESSAGKSAVDIAARQQSLKVNEKKKDIPTVTTDRTSSIDTGNVLHVADNSLPEAKEELDTEEASTETCEFRNYDPPRHYGLNEPFDNQPSFLSSPDVKYIRAKLPKLLNPSHPLLKKICIDTTEWESIEPGFLPFSDGQNPSLVSLSKNPYSSSSSDYPDRLDNISALEDIYGAKEMEEMFLGLVLFGDSQCRWNKGWMSAEQLKKQKFSPLTQPPSKRTLVVVFDKHRRPIGNAVLELEHDALWGKKRVRFQRKEKKNGGFERSIVELDDARMFFHNGRPHVLFRNGPAYGYEAQIQHPIHITKSRDGKFEAHIKASEMFEVCCGRNIAFISEEPTNNKRSDELMALTWVDPVTVEAVATSHANGKAVNTKRQLRKQKKDKSHIHGTNGYLLPLHTSSELLGIAHFHRPDGRDKNEYARFGHHYTHAFFTIQRKESSSGSEKPKFALKRLSNEFIFESATSATPDGDLIQFASGLDLIGSDTTGKLLISYGINDCESASFFVDMTVVQKSLMEVKDGQEVVNLMSAVIAPSQ